MKFLYRGIFLRALRSMSQGQLQVTLPEGKILRFGQSLQPIHAGIRINHEDFFRRVVLYGDIGFGESYVQGEWDSPNVEDLIAWFILNLKDCPGLSGGLKKSRLLNILNAVNRWAHLMRGNTRRGSRKNIRAHYDLGNAFFAEFLDPTMTYSAAYFSRPEQTLEEAQIAKYEALCRKLRISPADHVLEIGCGWGGFAAYAAETYGCRVTGITLSQEQHSWALERIRQAGLSDRVRIELKDYRDVRGRFDKIVSIEMLEAVGESQIEAFCAQCDRLLKPNGLLGIQFITCPDARYSQFRDGVDWIQKHVFPGSLLMSVGRVNQAFNATSEFFLHHLEDIGRSYAKTLGLWHERFQAKLDAIRRLRYDERFLRLWSYYLLYTKAAFRMHNISVVQAVYTRPNNALFIQESDFWTAKKTLLPNA